MVPVALGTQTAGSVMRPAAYCGVYGFKPAWGWASTTGIWRLSEHLDTVGLFARSVADLRLTYHALALGQRPPAHAHHATGPPRRTRSGRPRSACSPGRSGPAATTTSAPRSPGCGRLSDAGWQVREMAMPESWRHLPGHQEVVMAAEVAKNLHAALGAQVSQISESAQAIVERGDRCLAQEYLAALAAKEEALQALAPLSATTDLVLMPSALGAAPAGLASTGDPVMCRAVDPARPAHRQRAGLAAARTGCRSACSWPAPAGTTSAT